MVHVMKYLIISFFVFLCVLEVKSMNSFLSVEFCSQTIEIKRFDAIQDIFILSKKQDESATNQCFSSDYIHHYRSTCLHLNHLVNSNIQHQVDLKFNQNQILSKELRFRTIDSKGIYLQHVF